MARGSELGTTLPGGSRGYERGSRLVTSEGSLREVDFCGETRISLQLGVHHSHVTIRKLFTIIFLMLIIEMHQFCKCVIKMCICSPLENSQFYFENVI